MKKLVSIILLFAAGLIGLISCSKHDDPATPVNDKDVILSAMLLNTKISIEPEEKAGAKLAWEANDVLALYNSSTRQLVSLFTLIDGAGTTKGSFKLTQGEYDPTQAAQYVVKYPYKEGENTLDDRYKGLENQSQEGNDNTKQLKCYMSGGIQVSGEKNTIYLNPELAILSVTMTVPQGYDVKTQTIITFSFFDGEKNYDVNVNGITAWDGNLNKLKIHLMLLPKMALKNYRLCVTTNDTYVNFGINQFICNEGSKGLPLEAGKHYWIDDHDDLTMVKKFTLADITAGTVPTGVEWMITDQITQETDLTVLLAALNKAATPVNLSLPYATGIKKASFQSCTKIKYVDAPLLEFIGDSGFGYCTALTGLNIPAVKIIDTYAFRACSTMTYVVAPQAKVLRYGGFYDCQGLKEIAMPMLDSLGDWGLGNCFGLNEINLPNVHKVGQNAFRCLKDNGKITSTLAKISMSHVISVGESAFEDCALLTNVSMPMVDTIGVKAFKLCLALKSVDIPLVTYIKEEAFIGCSALETISLPNVVYLGDGTTGTAFQDCKALKSILCPKLTYVGKGTFNNCASLETVDFPNARRVHEHAFVNCTKLRSVSLPAVVLYGPNVLVKAPLESLVTAITSSVGNCDVNFLKDAITSNCVLMLGADEYDANVDIARKMWRGYTFKQIIKAE